MRAMSVSLAAGRALRLMLCLRVAVFADVAVAFGRAAALDHHVAVFLFGHAGHAAGHLLEALAVGGADLGQEVDVAAQRDAAVEVARQHGLLLVLGHRPLVQVGLLVGLEALAVAGFHERHAELVQVVAEPRLLGVEDGRAGHVLVGLFEGHYFSSGQYRRVGLSTSSLRCSSAVVAICGMKSTSRPSSGMWSLRFGCGQSVPHSTRSGKLSTTLRAK